MFKSIAEIDKLYRDHLDSLEKSGLPHDRTEIVAYWAAEVQEFKETHGLA